MAVYSVLHSFNSNEEYWKSYIPLKMKLYFTANSITDEDKQRAIILDVLGAQDLQNGQEHCRTTRPKQHPS